MKRLILLLVIPVLVSCGQATPLPPTPLPATATPTELPPPTDTSTNPPPPTTTFTSTAPPPTPTSATSFPNPNNYTWQEVASGLQRPVFLKNAGDGSGRLFIIEKVGHIRILQNGQLLADPFLDISDRVGSRSNEQGLLGLAFHPNFNQNGYFYVNYTDKQGNTHIARFTATSTTSADPNSEKRIFYVEQPYANHNGGMLAFGSDGYLYAGLGDGGSGGDPYDNAQNLNTPLGKILRLDVDHGDPYSIPADNPFGTEIWDYGLRNPWRFSFDTNGDMYIGDVGQNAWEEIDFVPAGTPGGLNFGWNILEGTHPYNGSPREGLTPPVWEYRHGPYCAVTGGYVYRGAMTEWKGIYLYGDYCSGTVWGLIHSDSGWQNQVLFETRLNITSFGQDENGEIYLVADSGQVLRLSPR